MLDMTPIQAINHFGTQRAIAEALGVTEGAVSQWCSDKYRGVARIPAIQQLRIEALTNGVLVADPDVPRGHKKRFPKPKAVS